MMQPCAVKPQLENIPMELRGLDQWCCWRYEYLPGRNPPWTKPPYQPNGQHAESDNPETWTTFAHAVEAYEKGNFSGIGFVLTEDDDFAGSDLDHCRDPETGAIEP